MINTLFHKFKNMKQYNKTKTTSKLYIKNLCFAAFVFCASFIPFNLSGQLNVLLKNIFKSEKVLLKEAAIITSKEIKIGTRFIYKNSDQVFMKISKESKILDGFKKNVDDFGLDILEFGSEFIPSDTPDTDREHTTKFDYFKEIQIDNLNPNIYKLLCDKFKKDTLNVQELRLALIGQKINNISITKENLYRLYFILSDKFAYNELIKIHEYYSGDKIKQGKIESLALDRGLVIDSVKKTSKEEETSYIDIIFGFLILILILYIIFKIYIKIKLLVQKIIALFSKKN